ncbi:hypothetical protein P154DRAFT_573164 [Amniculicola lignicola CBS 123094]|uniref:Uncharacterized protein n=1 Tax=Amniculicola lignicola CBS 123094 TaxID=1392246 RepID=A0A6A5WPV1_9PLEO|nr:hypothetical protein P154DRAFT_573164 [Amniculicola lignicola CBS 123094]
MENLKDKRGREACSRQLRLRNTGGHGLWPDLTKVLKTFISTDSSGGVHIDGGITVAVRLFLQLVLDVHGASSMEDFQNGEEPSKLCCYAFAMPYTMDAWDRIIQDALYRESARGTKGTEIPHQVAEALQGFEFRGNFEFVWRFVVPAIRHHSGLPGYQDSRQAIAMCSWVMRAATHPDVGPVELLRATLQRVFSFTYFDQPLKLCPDAEPGALFKHSVLKWEIHLYDIARIAHMNSNKDLVASFGRCIQGLHLAKAKDFQTLVNCSEVRKIDFCAGPILSPAADEECGICRDNFGTSDCLECMASRGQEPNCPYCRVKIVIGSKDFVPFWANPCWWVPRDKRLAQNLPLRHCNQVEEWDIWEEDGVGGDGQKEFGVLGNLFSADGGF